MFRLLKVLCLTLTLASLAFFAASCGSSSTTKMRVLNAIPDANSAGLDVNVNTTKVTTSALTYTEVEPVPPAYFNVPSGNVAIQAYNTGTTTSVFPGGGAVSATFSGSTDYTVILAGGLATATAVQFTDNNTVPPTGDANFRVIHVSPSGPANLDIYIVPVNTDITSVNPTFASLAYEQASSTYFSTAAGTYWFIVTQAGIKNPLFIQTYTVTAGQVRTLVLVDNQLGGLSNIPIELNDVG